MERGGELLLERAEVLVENAGERLQVELAHRGDLTLMNVERLPVVLDAALVGVPDRRQLALDVAHGALERLVVAGADDRAVEHRVRAHDTGAITTFLARSSIVRSIPA